MPTNVEARFARQCWIGFALLSGAYMIGFFHRMAPAAVSAELMVTFQTSAAALGGLAAAYYYVYTALQLPAGIIADTLGPRFSVGICLLLAAAGSVLFGLANSFEVATLGRLMMGVGVSLTFVGQMKYNSLWFPEKRYGMISGLTITLGNVGAIAAAWPLAYASSLISWRWLFVGIGILTAVVAFVILWRLRNQPEDAGLPSLQTLMNEPPHPKPEHHWLKEMGFALKNPKVWPGFVVMFGLAGPVFAFAGLWGVPILRDLHNVARADAATYTTALLIGLAVGSLFSGSLSDRLGRRKPVIAGASLLGLIGWSGLLWSDWQPGPVAYLLYIALGLAGGGISVVYAAVKETSAPLFAGMTIAVVNTGLFLGAAIAQPLFGWVLDRDWDGLLVDGVPRYSSGDYHSALCLYLSLGILALLASLLVTETHCTNIHKKPERQ